MTILLGENNMDSTIDKEAAELNERIVDSIYASNRRFIRHLQMMALQLEFQTPMAFTQSQRTEIKRLTGEIHHKLGG
jgi:hypothetical protein